MHSYHSKTQKPLSHAVMLQVLFQHVHPLDIMPDVHGILCSGHCTFVWHN